jgi:uncharacterized protein YndB with AHSA1/START domain
MSATLQVTYHFAAAVEAVYALMADPDFLTRKYADQAATDIGIEHDDRDGMARNVITRKVTVDLPGFAKKVMSPTNTVVQTDDWAAPDGQGRRICTYTVEVRGVPSRNDGTVTLTPDGAGTRQDVEAQVKVSIPLLGGKLEKFAVDSGAKALQAEADFTAAEIGR